MIVTSELLSNIHSNKIIPIIKQYGTHDIPTFEYEINTLGIFILIFITK
jgi:hypothetical protein